MQGELIRKERGGMRKLKRDEDRGQRNREISEQSDINHNNHNLGARHDKEEKEGDREKERKKSEGHYTNMTVMYSHRNCCDV